MAPWSIVSSASAVHLRFATGRLSRRSRSPWARSSDVDGTRSQVDARSGLRPLLDAILTSRYPDPAVRRGLVESVIETRALDVRLPNPTSIVADYQQLQTDVNATWLYLGTRNTAALTLYTQKLEPLMHEGDPPPPPGRTTAGKPEHRSRSVDGSSRTFRPTWWCAGRR
jgi:hypothetical protein